MQSNKDKIIVAHIDRQARKKSAEFAKGKRDAMQSISYRAKGYVWQQCAYNRGYRHGLYLLATQAADRDAMAKYTSMMPR